MTTEQFKKIALFMGWKKRNCTDGFVWLTGDGPAQPQDKTSLTNAEAVELLEVLHIKGFGYCLDNRLLDNTHQLRILRSKSHALGLRWDSGFKPTIPEAVAAATLALLEKEER